MVGCVELERGPGREEGWDLRRWGHAALTGVGGGWNCSDGVYEPGQGREGGLYISDSVSVSIPKLLLMSGRNDTS